MKGNIAKRNAEKRYAAKRDAMVVIASRMRNQAPPPHILFEALTEPNRDPNRPWLDLLDDEVPPQILHAESPELVAWSSLWVKRPDAIIEFDIRPGGGGTDLRFTVYVDAPSPPDVLIGHIRKRMNELIQRDLRLTFGQ